MALEHLLGPTLSIPLTICIRTFGNELVTSFVTRFHIFAILLFFPLLHSQQYVKTPETSLPSCVTKSHCQELNWNSEKFARVLEVKYDQRITTEDKEKN